MTARTEHSGDFKIREQVQGESGGDEWGWLFFFLAASLRYSLIIQFTHLKYAIFRVLHPPSQL